MIFLYNIFIQLYLFGIRVAALKNQKAKSWLDGRKNLLKIIQEGLRGSQDIVWIHASSAGEFEQAKPVIEAIKTHFSSYKIVITLFSPSGYGVAKKYSYVDHVFYLPADTSKNASAFLNLINPKLVIFVKYDFWYHHLKAVHSRKIPLLLISAVFRKDQAFFKWYGTFLKDILLFFDHIFLQDKRSLRLLQDHRIQHCSISGDTRFDRVVSIANQFVEVPYISLFLKEQKAVVAGSTWPDDEMVLKETVVDQTGKLIIAPHEINKEHIEQIQQKFPSSQLYSSLKNGEESDSNVLIIDNVGMLSRLYKYAHITYIGGGFTRDGIHNTLEAAIYGKPVLFGPNFKKFREAQELIEAGGGFSFSTADELNTLLQKLLNDEAFYSKAGKAASDYVLSKQGATQKILAYIQENRLLTK